MRCVILADMAIVFAKCDVEYPMQAAGTAPVAIAVNPVNQRVYVANYTSSNVSVITPAATAAIPLTTAISSLASNQTGSATPSFTFTPTSRFSPTAPAVTGVYFQTDTWQGSWQQLGGSGPYTGTTTPLSAGTHVLYAYAVDGEEATSVNTGFGSSPLIGQMAAYVFTVVPPAPSVVSIAPAGSPAANATSFNFTVTFDAAVINVDASDFSLTATGSATASIGTPTTANGGLAWTIPISAVAGCQRSP